jgi:membrane-bound lytic murein transglycosylase B
MKWLLILLLSTSAFAESDCRAKLGSAARGLTFDNEVIGLLGKQPEFNKPFWSYIESAVSEARIKQGRGLLTKNKGLFDKIERETGVDRHVITAIWGMETGFGANKGSKPILRSLFTLACNGHRQEFFTKEFMAAAEIARSRENGAAFIGSWAGAFGHTQFMPTTYLRAAIDGDGDGKRNLIGSEADALASTGNLLKQEGWQKGMTWGYEVILQEGFDFKEADGKITKPFSRWAIRRADDGAAPRIEGVMFLPAGAQGPAFLLTPNFKAILKYNNSESYALAVAHLADRLRGMSEFENDWPRADILSHNERVRVQQALISQGFLQGEADGRMGSKTRDAVRTWQIKKGVMADGFVTRGLLNRF